MYENTQMGNEGGRQDKARKTSSFAAGEGSNHRIAHKVPVVFTLSYHYNKV
jgi:hypothetical protein